MTNKLSDIPPTDSFAARHIGPRPSDVDAMLKQLGYDSLDALIDAVVPPDIRLRRPMNLPNAMSEEEVLGTLRHIADQNEVRRSYIGMGYYDCITPPVILRNILENPGGTRHTRRTSQRSHRADSKRCSISKRSSRISPDWKSQTPHCSMKVRQQPKLYR